MTSKTIDIPYAGGFGVRSVSIPGPYSTFVEMKQRNRQRKLDGLQGGEYWGPEEMRFFDGRTHGGPLMGRFIINSRQFHGSNHYTAPREYNVCIVGDDGDVDKIAFPTITWDGKPRGNDSTNAAWKEEFNSAQDARDALRAFVKQYADTEVITVRRKAVRA